LPAVIAILVLDQKLETILMTKQRIGAYGGTFDPIHVGHMEIARSVVSHFALDALLVIPAYKPPHKSLETISDSRHRYEMCVLAFADEPQIAVSKMEIDLPERPYTINTIERLRAAYGEAAELFFVMGADSFEEITSWRDYQRLLAGTNLIVASRAGHEVSTGHLPEGFRQRVVDMRGQKADAPLIKQQAGCLIYLTDFVNREVSSTDIRRRVQAGMSIAGLTAQRVIDYIEQHRLYRSV
jgi:nicotinate-nucleotide adenylyltransferase